MDLKQANKQTKTLHFEQIAHSLLPEIPALWPPGGPWPLVWEPVASSSRISQASCPERPWALDADTRPDPRVVTIRDTEGIWTALGVYMCVCVCVYVGCSFSWTTVEPVQICAAVFFVCACLYGQFFPGVNCWSSTNGRCWGVGFEGSRVLLEHLPLFLLSQALVRSGEEWGGNGGEAIQRGGDRRGERRDSVGGGRGWKDPTWIDNRPKHWLLKMGCRIIKTPFHFWSFVLTHRGYKQGHELYSVCVYVYTSRCILFMFFMCVTNRYRQSTKTQSWLNQVWTVWELDGVHTINLIKW